MKFLGNKMYISCEECEETQFLLFSQENTCILLKILKHVAHQLADNNTIFNKGAHHHLNRHLREHGAGSFFSSTGNHLKSLGSRAAK